MRLLFAAVLLSLSVGALGQGGQQGQILKPQATSEVHPAVRKAVELEIQARTLTDAGNHAAALPLLLTSALN